MIATHAAVRADSLDRVQAAITAARVRAERRRAADRAKRRRRDAGLAARHSRKEARLRAGLENS